MHVLDFKEAKIANEAALTVPLAQISTKIQGWLAPWGGW
jgi:hypothetical protein